MKEHPTTNIDYMRKNGKVSFGVSSGVGETIIADLTINIITPLDSHETCSAALCIQFEDNYRAGTIYEKHPIIMQCDVQWMKMMIAFPGLLEIFSEIKGNEVSILELCNLLEGKGYKWIRREEINNELKSLEYPRSPEVVLFRSQMNQGT